MDPSITNEKIACLTISNIRADYESLPEPDVVLPGLWAGTVGCLITVGNVDKGIFLFEIAYQIANIAKQNFLRIPIKKHGSVVIFAGDDTADLCLHRSKIINKFTLGMHTRDSEDDDESFPFSPPFSNDPSHPLKIYPVLGYRIDLLESPWINKIKPILKECRLCIFDNISRFVSSEEHSPASSQKLLFVLEQLARETGCAILFTHDIGGVLNEWSEIPETVHQYASLIGKTVWQSSLSVMSEEEAKKNYQMPHPSKRENFLRFRIHKNHGSPMPDFWLKRHNYGMLIHHNL